MKFQPKRYSLYPCTWKEFSQHWRKLLDKWAVKRTWDLAEVWNQLEREHALRIPLFDWQPRFALGDEMTALDENGNIVRCREAYQGWGSN